MTGEFPAQGPVTRSFGVFFDLLLNKRLSKQSWGSWFDTSSHSLWRHCNADEVHSPISYEIIVTMCLQLFWRLYVTDNHAFDEFPIWIFYLAFHFKSILSCFLQGPVTLVPSLCWVRAYKISKLMIKPPSWQWPNSYLNLTRWGLHKMDAILRKTYPNHHHIWNRTHNVSSGSNAFYVLPTDHWQWATYYHIIYPVCNFALKCGFVYSIQRQTSNALCLGGEISCSNEW